MESAVRDKNFREIDESLKCRCIGDHPIYGGGIPMDWTSIRMGYVCVKCGLYMDEKVEKMKFLSRLNTVKVNKNEKAINAAGVREGI